MTPQAQAAIDQITELRRQNEDIDQLVREVAIARGYRNLREYAEALPDDAERLAEELYDMVAQTLETVDSHVKTATPSRD